MLNINNIDGYKEILHIYSNFLINMGFENHQFEKDSDVYAGTILQMFFVKNLSLQKMLDGVNFTSSEDIKLNKILDPTTIITQARSIYELLCVFELVYVLPDTDEKRLIMYNLWCLAGLNSRQNSTLIV